MKGAVADVEKFMRACGQETPDVPQMTKTAELYFGDPMNASPNDLDFCGLVGEEVRELFSAWAKRDDVEVLDGALDTIWTIIAGLRALGFPIVLGWEEVAASNHAKIDPDTGEVLRREDGKILKPLDWQPPDLRRVLDKHGMEALTRAAMEIGAPTVKQMAPIDIVGQNASGMEEAAGGDMSATRDGESRLSEAEAWPSAGAPGWARADRDE